MIIASGRNIPKIIEKDVVIKLNDEPIRNTFFKKSSTFSCVMPHEKTQKIYNCYFDEKSIIINKGVPLEIRKSNIKCSVIKGGEVSFHNCFISCILQTKEPAKMRFFNCLITGDIFNKKCIFKECNFKLNKPRCFSGFMDNYSRKNIIFNLLKRHLIKEISTLVILYLKPSKKNIFLVLIIMHCPDCGKCHGQYGRLNRGPLVNYNALRAEKCSKTTLPC